MEPDAVTLTAPLPVLFTVTAAVAVLLIVINPLPLLVAVTPAPVLTITIPAGAVTVNGAAMVPREVVTVAVSNPVPLFRNKKTSAFSTFAKAAA